MANDPEEQVHETAEQELERFRREWAQEVKQRRLGPQQGVSSEPRDPEPQDELMEKHKFAWKEEGSMREKLAGLKLDEVEVEDEEEPPVASSSVSPKGKSKASPNKYTPLLPTATKLRSIAASKAADAVVLYSRAVEAEQTGRLNEALGLYRRAFRLDDGVDRAYQRHVARLESQASHQLTAPTAEAKEVPKPPEAEKNFTFRQHIQMHPDYDGRHRPQQTAKTSPLVKIFMAKHEEMSQVETGGEAEEEPMDHIAFRPADEDKPMPIASLPDELLGHIFQYLDVKSLERFATACWRSREVVGMGADAVWRDICRKIYNYPQVPRGPSLALPALVQRHNGDHRSAFIEEPRVRMDGCYISVCHYIRPGASEAWVAITHMITYHRFLRFYPNGSVISFLTTDHPSDVIPTLKPSLRAKGLHHGEWQLVRPEVDESGSTKGEISVVIKNLVEPGVKRNRYEFEMKLGLKSTQRGRWNKLDLQEYQSINLESEETLLLSLKHQKPFYFSKVRSYLPSL